jgi:fatty acid desaturase
MARMTSRAIDALIFLRALAIWGLLLGQPALWLWALWPLPITWPIAIAILAVFGLIGCFGEVIWRTKIRPERLS